MKILVNAINLRVAGGLSVGVNFLRTLTFYHTNIQVIGIVPPNCGYEEFACKSTKIIVQSGIMSWPIFRPLFLNYYLKKIVKLENPDIIFQMGNFASSFSSLQVLLLHWSYALYPGNKEIWHGMSLTEFFIKKARLLLFKRSLRYSSAMIVQTTTAKNRLFSIYDFKKEILIMPNAIFLPPKESGLVGTNNKNCDTKEIKLLCFSRYYSHKNLEILIPLAELFRRNNISAQIFITISEAQGSGAKKILDTIKNNNLSNHITNLGPIKFDKIPELYNNCDALLLPTLLESFSGTYVEAMYYGLPIFTSDRDFAHDVCGEAAYYFDPHSAENIYITIINAYHNPDLLQERVEKGFKRLAEFPSWQENTVKVVDFFNYLIEKNKLTGTYASNTSESQNW